MRGIKSIKHALQIVYLAIGEKEIPWYSKVIFIAILFAYIISPIDAIPEFVPILGVIDDILAIPLSIYLALWLIPKEILEKLKTQTGENDITVKDSLIHGRGVFAQKDFKEGDVVIKWNTSKLLSKDEINKLPKEEQRYLSYYEDGKYILHQPPARFVNHSCDPNTMAKDGADVAIRNIKAGEEITADYTKEKIPDLNFKCNCGSRDCKGIIKINN